MIGRSIADLPDVEPLLARPAVLCYRAPTPGTARHPPASSPRAGADVADGVARRERARRSPAVFRVVLLPGHRLVDVQVEVPDLRADCGPRPWRRAPSDRVDAPRWRHMPRRPAADTASGSAAQGCQQPVQLTGAGGAAAAAPEGWADAGDANARPAMAPAASNDRILSILRLLHAVGSEDCVSARAVPHSPPAADTCERGVACTLGGRSQHEFDPTSLLSVYRGLRPDSITFEHPAQAV